MCFVVLRCILERENSCEILQYLGETKANQILKPKVVPERNQYSRTRFQLILPVHSHDVTKNLTGHRMHVGRSVRSSLHISPENLRISKWPLSGKNVSKHPMLSISMALNVISCKKVERNTQKLKISDFTM